jgi:hypothetical protein
MLFSDHPKVNVLGFLNCSTQVISETTWLLAVARIQACNHLHACGIIYLWILLLSPDPQFPLQLWAIPHRQVLKVAMTMLTLLRNFLVVSKQVFLGMDGFGLDKIGIFWDPQGPQTHF